MDQHHDIKTATKVRFQEPGSGEGKGENEEKGEIENKESKGDGGPEAADDGKAPAGGSSNIKP